jgi:hypothetical protein
MGRNLQSEIETMMRDGGKAYLNDPGVQREYREVLVRLAGEAPPPLSPVAPAGTSSTAEAPPAPAEP